MKKSDKPKKEAITKGDIVDFGHEKYKFFGYNSKGDAKLKSLLNGGKCTIYAKYFERDARKVEE